MKQISAYAFLVASFIAPVISFAHGDGDGHEDVPDVAHPEHRIYVSIVIVVVFALMGGFILYSRAKDKPTKDTPPQKPAA